MQLKTLTLNGTTYDSFPTEVDTSLTQSGKAADAKAVGDALENVNATNIYIGENTSTTVDEEGNVTTVEGGGGGGGNSTTGGSSAFTLLDTLDFSTEELAVMSGGKTYSLNGVEEILLVWKGMQNSTATQSNLLISIAGTGINAVSTGKSGTGLAGYTIIKVYNGVGTHVLTSAGAISATNYQPASTNQTLLSVYNLLPNADPITSLRVGNPSTQYYAVAGTVKVYVR